MTITTLPRISESEREDSSVRKSSREDYLVIEQEKREERREGEAYEGDGKSGGSSSSNGPILPDACILPPKYVYTDIGM